MALIINHSATARPVRDAAGKPGGIFRASPGASGHSRLDSSCDIAAENRRAAQARLYDLDVALEMINFVRETILAQPGVAMLSQNNSIPAMALRLLAANGAK